MSKQIAARIGNNTDWIDYIRFDESDPTGTECNKAETGKIGVKGGQYIQAISGPMSCVKCYNPQKKTTDIRLYFVIGGALREAKLADAGSSSDLKGGWVLMPEGGADDMPSVTSTNGLDRNTRLVDQTSYMSSGKTSGKDPEHQLPYVVYQVLNEPNVIRYAWATGMGDQATGQTHSGEVALVLDGRLDTRLRRRQRKLPDLSDAQQREMLNIRIVGGGAIGIEATAEIYDLWHEDMRFLYPHLDGNLTITIHDVAPTILSTFDKSLGDYALKSLRQKNVQIKTSSHIEKVEQDAIYTKEEGRMAYGMLIGATGNGVNPLLDDLAVKKAEKGLPRILTDKYLRVLQPDGTAMENAYAMGDAADIDGHSLPTLAEVALQKGEYLSRELNNGDQPTKPFEYKQRALMAYLGRHDGIVGGRSEWTGESAWLAWRSGSLAWTRSWRRKIMISLSWVFVWFGGRDIARK